MSRIEELPPDQRAALSLLLRQRKSYVEVATLLSIPERAVRARAHAALAVLAPRQARQLTAERRQDIGDYLLAQQGVAERLATRTFLNASEPGRAWAQAIAAELAPLASGPLPDVPAGPAPALAPSGAPAATGAPAAVPRPARAQGALGGVLEGPSSSTSLPSSRLGGALLLAAIVVAVVVAVVLLTSGGGSSHPKTSAVASTPASTGTTSAAKTTASGPTVTARIALRPAVPTSRDIGALEVLSEDGKYAFYIAAEHLPPSRGFFYAIWLYNSPTSSLPLSKSPPVGTNERLAGGASLPSNAGAYREVLVTRETSEHPTHPGVVVLRAPFTLG